MLIAAALVISRSSLYYRKKPRDSGTNDEQNVVGAMRNLHMGTAT